MGLLSKRRRKSSLAGLGPLRWLGPGVTLFAFLFGAYLFLIQGWTFSGVDGLTADESGNLVSNRGSQRLRLGTFNLQRFVDSESSLAEQSEESLQALAEVVAQYDCLALQELRDQDDQALLKLIGMLEEKGFQYQAVVSQKLGPGGDVSYAFLFDRRRIGLINDSAYVVSDPSGLMSRPPMVASFVASLPEGAGVPFRFTAINVVIAPSGKSAAVDGKRVDSELEALANVFRNVRAFEQQRFGEDDFVVLGDFARPPTALGAIREIPGVVALDELTLRRSRSRWTHDHVFIDASVTGEAVAEQAVALSIDSSTGQAGSANQLKGNQASSNPSPGKTIASKDLSALPVWSEFTVTEHRSGQPVPSTASLIAPQLKR